MSELKYKNVATIRKEILEAVNVDTGDRFDGASQSQIRLQNLLIVAAELQPEDDPTNFAEMKQTTIYKKLGRWLDYDNETKNTHGSNWRMNRGFLKRIHRELVDE